MSNRSGLDGLTVLVIDDEAVFRTQVSAILQQLGIDVIEASGAACALELLAERQPDLILCDLVMPELDGIGFLKALSELNLAIPVVMVSAQNDMQRVDRAIKQGASDYLFKPIRNIDDLIFTISSNIHPVKLDTIGQADLVQSELAEHLGHFRANDLAATRLMSELLPDTPQLLSGYHINYRRFGAHIVPEFLPLNDGRVCIMAFDLSSLGQDAAVAGIIVKSLINEGYRRYCNGRDDMISDPAKFCGSLNRQLWRAQIKAAIPYLHLVTDDSGLQFQYCNAGFVESCGNIKLTDELVVGCALGTSDLSRYQNVAIKMMDDIVDIGVGNLHGERLYLKISLL